MDSDENLVFMRVVERVFKKKVSIWKLSYFLASKSSKITMQKNNRLVVKKCRKCAFLMKKCEKVK